MDKPWCVDLFCGLGGWSEGFLSEGYRCTGYDIEAHDYGSGGYPGELILRDVRSIHGSELKDAACIVGSSPCQEFSYRAMPWKRAKALGPPLLGIELFNAQLRIQREASEAAGHYIPMVVENVRGAQRWVGRARWNYGSFYLWGDVPALMPLARAIKNSGGSWFNVAHNKSSGCGNNPDGRKGIPHRTKGHWTNPAEHEAFAEKGFSKQWRDSPNGMPMMSSKSSARKAASAVIAKIPFPLSRHIARCFLPVEDAAQIASRF